MKTCLGCKHAWWRKTAAGKLHSSGEGICRFPYAVPPLPASMYWFGNQPPRPKGGLINRHEENNGHCTYYNRTEDA